MSAGQQDEGEAVRVSGRVGTAAPRGGRQTDGAVSPGATRRGREHAERVRHGVGAAAESAHRSVRRLAEEKGPHGM